MPPCSAGGKDCITLESLYEACLVSSKDGKVAGRSGDKEVCRAVLCRETTRWLEQGSVAVRSQHGRGVGTERHG